MEHDIKFYIFVVILTIISIASLLSLNLLLIVISLSIAAFLIAFYKLYYILEAVLFKRTNLIQVIDSLELSGDRITAIRKVGGKFCAIAVALINNGLDEAMDRNKVESIIANTHFPFRFIMQVERVDINKLLDRLQTKRSMLEIELGKLGSHNVKSNVLRMNSVRRRIDQLDHDIGKISSGGAPLKVSQYIMTSSVSENKFNAQEHARSQLRELSSQFGAIAGAHSTILEGNDLLDLLKFDAVGVMVN